MQGLGILKSPENWHMSNGSGETIGPGSGERFLAFHQNYIGCLRDWIKTQGVAPAKLKKFVLLPKWKPSTKVPGEFSHPGRNTHDPKVKTPTWLSVKRGKTRSPEFHRKSLGEFKTSDELGRGNRLELSRGGAQHGWGGHGNCGFSSQSDILSLARIYVSG